MGAVTANVSTVTAMREKVRRLTASPDESQLSTADIDKYINTFYDQDFPYAIKLDQLRVVYEFFTKRFVVTAVSQLLLFCSIYGETGWNRMCLDGELHLILRSKRQSLNSGGTD